MKRSVAMKWIKALRSGKYEQGKGRLKTNDKKFCCLGVLCDISKKGEWKANIQGLDNDYVINKGSSNRGHLPAKVREWAGISSHYVRLDSNNSLTEENDTGTSFYDISCIIEDYWELM